MRSGKKSSGGLFGTRVISHLISEIRRYIFLFCFAVCGIAWLGSKRFYVVVPIVAKKYRTSIELSRLFNSARLYIYAHVRVPIYSLRGYSLLFFFVCWRDKSGDGGGAGRIKCLVS